jgi:hypothetical protein
MPRPTRTLALLAATLTLALGLGACTAPQNQAVEKTPAPLDVEAAQKDMAAALPQVASADITETLTSGLDEASFGDLVSTVDTDYDAKRVARTIKTFQSAGWSDIKLGDAYYAVTELVRMDSTASADQLMTEIARAASEDSVLEGEGDEATVEYTVSTVDPRPEWPSGSAHADVRILWPGGSRASGTIGYASFGPYILTAWGAAAAFDGSPEALDAFWDAQLADTIDRVSQLEE